MPRVSIITTVYDRIECLERCLKSTRRLIFPSFEQIVIADNPPNADEIRSLATNYPQVKYFLNLPERMNDFGATPAEYALQYATGEFVCFLSDDNAYMPDHLGPLVAAFDNDPELGFVYSSCLYNGTHKFQTAPPTGGLIDLGQPLIRRELLGGKIPGKGTYAWDWVMIATLLERGVKWKHVDQFSFIFRLTEYPLYVQMLTH